MNELELTISSIKIQTFKDIYKMNVAFDKKYYKEGMKHLLKMKETYLKNGGALTNRDGKNIENYINEPFPWMKGGSTCGCMKSACNIPLM